MIGTQNIDRARQKVIKTSTIRQWDGGWNVIDSQLNLTSKYSPILRNFVLGEDATIRLRYGTKWFAEVPYDIVNIEYHSGKIVVVTTNGYIYSINGQAEVSLIWSPDIAYALPGHPNGWASVVRFVSFAKFKGELIICNGQDKPLIISRLGAVDYLQDLGTLTNINTPVCKYVISASDFMVMAGDPLNPSLIHISSQGTSGTWFGDPQPNIALQQNLGGRITQGDPAIKGICVFRDRLAVGFAEGIVIGKLGVFNDDGDHTPEFDDLIQEIGIEAHRSIQTVGDDVLFCDLTGVPSLNRTVLTETIRPDRASQLIDPEIQKEIQSITDLTAIEDYIFSVYDRYQGLYMLFMPQENELDASRESRAFVYKSIPVLKISAWCEFRDWNWRAAARSAEGIVFFANDRSIFELGRQQEPHSADFIGEQESWTDDTAWSDGTGWAPVADIAESGVPISAVWETPWADFGQRQVIKNLKYLGIEASGRAKFTIKLFVDGLYEDLTDPGETWSDGSLWSDGTGWERLQPLLTPQLELEMLGSDAGGLGTSQFGVVPMNLMLGDDERLFAAPAKFKIAKLRIEAYSMKELSLISVSWFYTLGGIRRL